ncbi:MAG TPA: sigma-70 family RNA polymerase sigma factor [Micromonosporaceae bacterium]|nr:sigma-70 family RNA polymerase sigma factor [Micromonosporaceae bacterium]
MTDFDATTSLLAASMGEQRAWDAIVGQYSGLVWAVARGYRLAAPDAADVFQATWLRLVEHLGDIRDGSRLGAWLATTAKHEALALMRRNSRHVPTADIDVLGGGGRNTSTSVDDGLLRTEEHSALWRAFGKLSDSCQRLLRVIFADPAPSYAETSAALDIPVGSIGPTRARCLSNLQALLGALA